jgi:type I site-specific restriction-modification system R (restriction) subunit
MSYIHDQQPESFNDLFGEVIDSYTDAQALEDGGLVELYRPARFQDFPINRMTRHLFDDLAPFVEAEAGNWRDFRDSR